MPVFAVSALNAISSFIYIYMQYVSAPKALMVIGHFGWLHIHGILHFVEKIHSSIRFSARHLLAPQPNNPQ